MSGCKEIFSKPELFLSHFDQVSASDTQPGNACFVTLGEFDYRSPVFLQEISTKRNIVLSLSADEFIGEYNDQKPVKQVNAHIFHSAFCCSTLLSNLIDYKNRTLVLREPMAYLQLANWKRTIDDNASMNVSPDYIYLLNAVSSTMAEGFCEEENIAIKHHNLVSYIIDDILLSNENARGVYIYSDIKSFMVSVLKSDRRREWLRNQLSISHKDADITGGVKKINISELDEVTAAAYLWLLNVAKYLRAAERVGQRLCSLNSDVFLKNPVDVALKVCSHLGLVLDETCINEKVIHGVLSRHAKTPQLKYGSKQRQSEMNKISKKLRMEIKRGLKWAEMQAEFPIGRSLPNALVS